MSNFIGRIFFRNYWGPAYAGPLGYLKKAKELCLTPSHFPWICGHISAAVILANVPVNDDQMIESAQANKSMQRYEVHQQTGNYENH